MTEPYCDPECKMVPQLTLWEQLSFVIFSG